MQALRTISSSVREPRGGVGGGREGALTPPDLPNFLYIYIYIYIFFMCVVVKGGDLIEIVINNA